MQLHRIALAAAFAAGIAGQAQANIGSSTVGPVTTYTESFNGGSSFAGGLLAPGAGGDDYLLLSGLLSSATYVFSFATAVASLDLSFWYAGRTGNSGSVTFASLNQSLGNTPGNVLQYGFNNPGAESSGPYDGYDAFYSTTLTNLAAGNYTLTFAKGTGTLQTFKVDDVKLVVTAVPEPGTYALMLAGLGALGFAARRRRIQR